jgi:hypothetical protein
VAGEQLSHTVQLEQLRVVGDPESRLNYARRASAALGSACTQELSQTRRVDALDGLDPGAASLHGKNQAGVDRQIVHQHRAGAAAALRAAFFGSAKIKTLAQEVE